jgi:hypothetical protein
MDSQCKQATLSFPQVFIIKQSDFVDAMDIFPTVTQPCVWGLQKLVQAPIFLLASFVMAQ